MLLIYTFELHLCGVTCLVCQSCILSFQWLNVGNESAQPSPSLFPPLSTVVCLYTLYDDVCMPCYPEPEISEHITGCQSLIGENAPHI